MILSQNLAAFATIAVLVGGAVKTVIDREPCFVVKEAELLTPQVEAGGELQIRVVGDTLRECPYYRSAHLRDGANATYPYAPIRLSRSGPVRHDETFILRETIPVGATPGAAHYERWGEFSYSMTHKVWPLPPVLLVDVDFEIVESEETQRIREILGLLGDSEERE